MKERDFLNWIIACAETTGWKAYHVPAPMTAARGGGFVGAKRAAGLPDLFLLHDDPPRMIVAEVKGTGGKLSGHQQEFLTLASAVADLVAEHDSYGHERVVGVYAWLPENQSIIETILKSKVLM